MTASSETAPAHARNFIELSFRYVFQESKPVCSIAYWGIFPRIGFGKNGTGSDGHAGIYIDIQRRPLHAARVLSSASLPEGAPSVSKAPVRLLHELFSLQAARSPNSVAVVCDSTRLTYAELNQLSDRVAAQLAANGVGRNDCVAFLLERSPWVYVALLGILKAGAAYVPLDPDYPPDRIQFILGDCHAVGLLVSPELRHKCSAFSGCVLEVTAQSIHQMSGESRAFQPASQSQPEDLCYVIYTSGTTGRPKGVQIEHHSACHFVQTESRLFGIHSTDRVFQGFSIAFDASVEEIWLALANGATLVVGTSEVIHSGPGLSRWLAEAHVTVLSCVPTLLATLEEDVPDLRLLILGGEVCPPSLVRKWWKPGRVVINTYGPTEATVVATWAVCAPDKPVTIGRPLPGCIAVVVDESLNPVEGSEPGELLIGGAGVARGYLGRPELTAEKFIMYSFDQEAAKRFYRTGDRVRWTADGELEFLGRIDAQVKIRGFRVELSEIESVLLEAPEVQAAAVTLHGERLAAFVVQEPGATLSTPLLKARLRDRLPGYMIPASIEVLPALPTLPSGKIDRKALPVPSSPDRAGRPELIRPRNLCERQLVEMWSKHFGTADISITDDFFLDLGGHSLLAARTVSELRLIPGFELLSVADLYRWPTAGQLSEEIQKRWREAKLPANGAAAETKNGPRAVAVPFWRHFLCGLGQLFSLVFVLGFFALQWLAPYLTYTVMVEEDYDGMTSILAAFASLVLLYPVMLSVAIVLKWAVIGRYRPGNYPLWGWYYFRFWLVTAVESTVPVSYLSGTPLLNIYLRLMGAKIGRNVFIHSDNFAIYDLLAIGDGTSINADAALLGYTVSGGRLTIGAITIGSGCFVGARAAVAPNTAIADGGELEDLSLLPSGQSIGSGETWAGSPARRTAGPKSSTGSAMSEANGNESDGFAYTAAQALGLLIFPVLVVAALFPGIAVMNRLNYLDPYYWYLLLSPLIAVSFVSLLCLEIVLLKWVLLGKIKAGQHSLRSWYYVRKWFVDKTMELSLDVVGPLYASVYLSPWYKLLGAKLGHGAEISTASFISPDLLSIGEESFIADNASLGAPRVRNGVVTIGPNQIGRRAFIGNSALLPPGSAIGDDVLIGCLSCPPAERADALRRDSAWLGSPALFLPQRIKAAGFSEQSTYSPTIRLRVLRATIEFVRVVCPSTGFIILTSLLFSALLLLHDLFSLGKTLLFFPILYLGCGLAAVAFTALAKWILVGRYTPGERPLWSTFVWRNELINALHEHLAAPFLAGALAGTPFMSWYLRLLGAKIGRRVYIETTDFSEFDLVKIGDEAALNADCTIQTHLFEDRVMKMSNLEIASGCSVGAHALVLYDTRMGPGSTLGQLSLLMKGEVLPPGTSWAGIPARPAETSYPPAARDLSD